jgi:nucleoside-diphosphate-sugar epimerase
MTKRSALVTGGGGYVGSVLVQHLIDAGWSVRVLDALAVGDGRALLPVWGREGFEFLHGDIRDARTRASALEGMDAVVHLAAIVGDPACSREPDTARAVNLEATLALTAEAARAGVRRFVFASTCSNYGKMAEGDDWVTEDWELRPVSLYAETKVAAELEILASATSGFATTCLRLATVYGVSPRMRFDLTVNEFARDALLNRKLVVYGEQFWRPYVHVIDAARAIVTTLEAAADSVGGEVFNVGSSSENFRKQDLVDFLVARIPGLAVERVAQPDDPRDYRVSFSKIESALGYETLKTVPQGMDDVIAVLDSAVIADPFADIYRN